MLHLTWHNVVKSLHDISIYICALSFNRDFLFLSFSIHIKLPLLQDLGGVTLGTAHQGVGPVTVRLACGPARLRVGYLAVEDSPIYCYVSTSYLPWLVCAWYLTIPTSRDPGHPLQLLPLLVVAGHHVGLLANLSNSIHSTECLAPSRFCNTQKYFHDGYGDTQTWK